MPTSSPLAGPRELSDDDVKILNEIVTLACSQPGAEVYPFRNLYQAHEVVLRQHGLDQKHDNVYIRFISKLKDKPRDLTLYQFFQEKLYDRFGIEIEEADSQDDAQSERFLPSRRASLSSLPDLRNVQRLGADHRRPGSRASASYLVEDTRPLSPGPQWPKVNGTPRRPFDMSMIAQATPARRPLQDDDGLSDGTFDSDRDLPSRRISNIADWQPKAGRYMDYDNRNMQPPPVGHDADGFGPVNARLGALRNPDVIIPPTPGQLLADAERFRYYSLRHTVGGITDHWYSLTRRNLRANSYAVSYDKRQLVKPVYDNLIAVSDWKLDERQGQRLSDLRVTAEKKWDRHLKSKAFTHWWQCTNDEVEKTAAAKEHMLRFRCFQAWRDYATSNETRVRQHVCRKFLDVWKIRRAQKGARAYQALDCREETLLRQVLVHCVWTYREKAAVRLVDFETKRKAMAALVDRFRTIQSKEIKMMKQEALHALRIWQKRKQQVDLLTDLATQHEASHSLDGSFGSWRLQHRYAPLERSLLSKLDERVARSTFAKLVQVWRLRQQAKLLDRRRILRTAWDKWNDQLRSQSLSQRINERVVTECLYKWVLAERCILYQRLRTERLLERCTRKILDSTIDQSQALSDAYYACQASQESRMKRTAMRKWLDKFRTCRRHHGAAVATDERRMASQAFDLLIAQHEKIGMLETQYVPNFTLFYKGKQTLKVLEKACKASRAKKRHEAYVTVRRQVKKNACKKFLNKWRDDALGVQALKDISSEVYDGKLITLATDVFSRWQERVTEHRERELQVQTDQTALLAYRQLGIWREQNEIARENADKASEYDREHSRRAAYRCLRKLHFRIRFIQERQTRAYETELRQWSQRDLARNLLRLWLERSLRQRGVPEADLPPTAKTRRFKNMLKNLPVQPAVAEDDPTPPQQPRVQFQDHFHDQDQAQILHQHRAQPTPAAMAPFPSTPSRRFGRSLRTPAKAPLPLPPLAQSMLGVPQETPVVAAPATDSRVRQSRAFGRSAIGVRRTLFAPIPERSSFP